MAIKKPKNWIDVYRVKASHKDINELTGRAGRRDLTEFIIGQIFSKVGEIDHDNNVVDIGCGDGLFLQKIAENRLDNNNAKLIGILPTEEEVARVKKHLFDELDSRAHLVAIEFGTLENTNLPSEFADVVISNSTLHYLQNKTNVIAALIEMHRIAKKGGKIFIGEVADSDEDSAAGKNYGDSVIAWLFWVLKKQGVSQFMIRLKQTIGAIFSSEPFIIAPKKKFFMEHTAFSALLEAQGLKVIRCQQHKEIDTKGNIYERATRWDYLLQKT